MTNTKRFKEASNRFGNWAGVFVVKNVSHFRGPVSMGGNGSATDPKLDIERFQLTNGLVVLLSENHAIPSLSINAILLAGSRFEPDEKAGLASLVSFMLDEGTRTRTSDQIAESVESVGGRLHSAADYQVAGLQATFLSKDLSLAIDITSDVVANPIFPDEKIKQNIERRVAQLKSRLDVPRVLASDVFNEIVFSGHPQHRPPVGYDWSVRDLTRQDLIDFHAEFYVPRRAILAIVGDFDKVDVRHRIEDFFGDWRTSPRAADKLETVWPERQKASIERFVTVDKEQVNIYVGHLGIERRNPDYYALKVMDTILGSSPGFTSRIPRILRDEQGLAYTTFSNMTSSAGIDPGRFIAYIGTAPENLEKAVEGLRREIRRMATEPVTSDELEAARDYLTGSFVFDFQTNAQIADFLIEAEMYELGFDYLAKYPELIRSVTIEDVARVSSTYLHPDILTTVGVGPVDENGKVITSVAGSTEIAPGMDSAS